MQQWGDSFPAGTVRGKTIRPREPAGCVDHCCPQPRTLRRVTCSSTQATKRLNEMSESAEDRLQQGIKAILVASLIGTICGLILGGIGSGFLIALYFFGALGPPGPCR